jgi:hypothetical protein
MTATFEIVVAGSAAPAFHATLTRAAVQAKTPIAAARRSTPTAASDAPAAEAVVWPGGSSSGIPVVWMPEPTLPLSRLCLQLAGRQLALPSSSDWRRRGRPAG